MLLPSEATNNPEMDESTASGAWKSASKPKRSLVTKWLERTAAARPSELNTRKNERFLPLWWGWRDFGMMPGLRLPEGRHFAPVSSIFGKRCSQVLNYNLALDFRGRICIFLPSC